MKVVTNAQMREIDELTQQQFQISEQELMEEAGKAVARVVGERYSPQRVVVLCGKGNNAGDGYVVSRYLRSQGIDVTVLAVAQPEDLRGAAHVAFRQAKEVGVPIKPFRATAEILTQAEVIVDALCGTGIKGALRGDFEVAAKTVNALPSIIVAVDVPSGVREFASGEELGEIVKADLTVAIGAPKLCSVTLPGSLFTGELQVEKINFPSELLESERLQYNIEFPKTLGQWLPQRPVFGHKGTFGKVGIVAGSACFAGAAILAARAALRSGAGLVTVFTPASLNPIYKVAVPEATTAIVSSESLTELDATSLWPIVEHAKACDALAVGMGLGTSPDQETLVRGLIENCSCPLVLDADALTCLARHLPKLNENVVLTPHPGEMARLLNTTTAEIQRDRFAAAKECARRTNAVVLLKGADTLVARPDGQVWINSGGTSALAKGGSGDVLSGIIASLMGQGMVAWKAAVTAARLHLEAGISCARTKGERGVLASEVADEVPRVCDMWLEAHQ